MRGAIGPNQARAINRKSYRQTLNGHIMHNLIIAPLQEGRIHGAKRLHTTCGQSCRKGDAMLLSNAYIKTSTRITFSKEVQTSTIRHGGRHSTNFAILRGNLQQ